MATHQSAEKAARQALRHQARNITVRSQFRTEIKKFRAAVTAKSSNKEETKKKLLAHLSEIQRLLMKAASKKIIKKENASRQVARLSKAVHQATAAK